MDTHQAAQPQAAQEEEGEVAAAKVIIHTHLPLGRSSPRKVPLHKATAPSQAMQEWEVEVGHPNLKALPKE